MKNITQLIRNKATQLVKQNQAPSISIFIQKNDEVIIDEAFGYSNVNKKIEVTRGSLYNIGSMLKLMTASCIAILKDRNQLDFHSKVSDFLSKEFCGKTKTTNITIHQLLTHTSGLELGFVNVDFSEEFEYFKSLENALLEIELKNTSGTEVAYSNYGYGLLGLIIEKISGQKFETFLAENILIPLEFENINPISLSEENKAKIALPYVKKKDYFLELKAIRVKCFSAGEAYFTLSDYAKFIKMHMNKGMYGNKRIVKEETINLMHQNQTAGFDNGIYGYGCIWLADEEPNIKEEKYGKGIFHTGGVSGYSCSFTTNEKGNYFIIIAINALWEFDPMYELRDFCMEQLS